MHDAAILVKENKKLQAVNIRKKQKRAKKHKYIADEEILTDAEDLTRAQTTTEASRFHMKKIELKQSQLKKHASTRCSICEELDHKTSKCSQIEENSYSN